MALLLLDVKRRARLLAAPMACAAVALYFGYHALQGERGLRALRQLDEDITQARLELLDLSTERAKLNQDIELLRSSQLHLDSLDEQARAQLGLSGPNDVIVFGVNPMNRPAEAVDHPQAEVTR